MVYQDFFFHKAKSVCHETFYFDMVYIKTQVVDLTIFYDVSSQENPRSRVKRNLNHVE